MASPAADDPKLSQCSGFPSLTHKGQRGAVPIKPAVLWEAQTPQAAKCPPQPFASEDTPRAMHHYSEMS